MITINFKGRIVEVEGHLEIGEGFYITAAYYQDGSDLTDQEMQELEMKFGGDLYNEASIDYMSAAYDRAKDLRKYGE